MARANRLQDSIVRALKYGISDSAGNDKEWRNDGNGLYIRVRPNGKKSWVLRRKINKISKKTTLGHYPKLTLKKARLKAAQVRTEDEETANRSSAGLNMPGTFGELLQQFYAEQIAPRYKNPRRVRMYIDNCVPDSLKALTITNLGSSETREFRIIVRDWLVSYVKSSGPTGANKLLAIFKQTTRYGTAIGYLTVDPLHELTKKLVGGTEKPGSRTLTNDEIKKLWYAESPHLPLFRFLLLTGQRIGETQLANWSDIESERWLIPAEVAKNGRAHWVPITGPIRDILNALPRNRTKIFATRSTTRVQAWLRHWCKHEGIDPRFTPHDLRRTFVTELNELGVEPYVIEKLVNHSMSGVMGVYNRAEYSEGRIAAAKLWSDHVISVVGESDETSMS